MPRKVTKALEATQQLPAINQPLRVAAYCRVSSKHEEQQRSLDAQIDYYTDYIQSNPNWTRVAVYSDTASGTRTIQRPGYQQLIKDCNNKKVDLILVKSLSRLGRDALETTRQIRRLKKMNIGVYIEIGGLNTLDTSDSVIDQLAAIDRMLSNEKYVGEVRMQKTYTSGFLTGRRKKNTGQPDTYLVQNAHEPIINRGTFQLVQRMKGSTRRSSTSP